MIRLFQSNDMSTLMATFVARSLAAPIDPFEPETVVVQSFGMGQWLKLQTAAQVGIAANIRCELPADLVWNLYQRVLGAEVPAGSSPFGRERLAWHLMRELPRLQGERFAPVIHFLSGTGDPQVRTWQLAMKIAGLFDQYLVYRPEWILAWEAGTPKAPDHWLGDLWRQLRSSPGLRDLPHRAALHDRFVRGLETGPPPGVLPERISIFGLSSMPVMHLDAFRAASRHVEVDIYFLNPCQHYWGDVISEKDRERRSVRRLIDKDGSLDDFDYLDVGNPLLSSMGKEGREFMELMLEIDEIDVIDDWVEPPGENILQMIQRDVLNLEFGGEFGLGAQPTPTRVADDDTSLQIHACHSKMREVEVLQDQLYHLMRADPALSPADIIVMTPDVGAYAPYIDAVFRGRMRYAIADRSLREESAVLVAFTSLLALPDSRLASTDMMDLLEVPTIARKLGLFEDELSTITQWIQDAGIRFELDGAAKASRWEIPPEDYNTWQFGLDRLLLGYAMSEGTPFEDILPLDVTGSEGELLGKLCYFIELVAHWRESLEQPRSAVEWGQVISELIDAFFDPRGDEELDLATVRSAMVTLASNVEATGFEGDLTPRMVREWIEGELSDARQGRGFVSGGITFATLVPMRSIPFKVVCLLGMNDDSYPREDRPVEFDLMYREGLRKGDRSRRVDDRYLFLEALLSARHCLYISYEGRGIKDNQEKPPSILVSELLEYLERVFIGRSPVVVHPLQPFSPSYYRGDPRLVTYRDEWYDALVTPSAGDDFVGDGVPPQEDLAPDELGKLTAFFRNPAQYYLRNRLGVYFEEDDIELRETESFALDGLERYQLADGALQALVHGEDIAMWEARERCSGLVMPGPEGARQLARESARAQMVFDAVREHQGIPVPPVRAALAVGEYSIEGVVDYLYTNDDGTRSIINFRTGTLRKRQLLDAWVRHLFANATQGEVDTLLVSTDGEKVVENRIGAMAAADARQLIETLIGFYLEGLSSPLAFMPETSHAFAKATLEGEPDRKIVERTLSEWTRDMPGSEGTDRSYQRLFTWPDSFGEAFRQTALAIYVPLLEALGDAK